MCSMLYCYKLYVYWLLVYFKGPGRAWWCQSVISTIWVAEAGGSQAQGMPWQLSTVTVEESLVSTGLPGSIHSTTIERRKK